VIRRAIAGGLAGLGLIGGTASVVYNSNGDATVKIKDSTGKVQTVNIGGAGGQTFSCPSGTHSKLEPYDIKAGRIKLTLQQVRRQEKRIEQQYPGHQAPDPVVTRYRALSRQDDRLVAAFNAAIDAHNAILDQDCTAS
jgi:hypothetical protein